MFFFQAIARSSSSSATGRWTASILMMGKQNMYVKGITVAFSWQTNNQHWNTTHVRYQIGRIPLLFWTDNTSSRYALFVMRLCQLTRLSALEKIMQLFRYDVKLCCHSIIYMFVYIIYIYLDFCILFQICYAPGWNIVCNVRKAVGSMTGSCPSSKLFRSPVSS